MISYPYPGSTRIQLALSSLTLEALSPSLHPSLSLSLLPPSLRSYNPHPPLPPSLHPSPHRNMLDVLRDKEHLEFFRNFLASRGAVASDMPIQFWLAVEELKRCVHNRKLYLEKLHKIEERFLKGKSPSESESQSYALHQMPYQSITIMSSIIHESIMVPSFSRHMVVRGCMECLQLALICLLLKKRLFM